MTASRHLPAPRAKRLRNHPGEMNMRIVETAATGFVALAAQILVIGIVLI